MKLYQLADDPETYADIAGQWLVVSDDMEDELAGPFKTRAEAAKWLEDAMATETFFPLADMEAWEAFYSANIEALQDVADKATCFALACNCELIVGGGAAPLFRVGFED